MTYEQFIIELSKQTDGVGTVNHARVWWSLKTIEIIQDCTDDDLIRHLCEGDFDHTYEGFARKLRELLPIDGEEILKACVEFVRAGGRMYRPPIVTKTITSRNVPF